MQRFAATVCLVSIIAAGTTGVALAQSAPPDIAQGLCVGASLDLSAASQARCKAFSQAAQQRPPMGPPNIGAGLCVGASLNLSLESQINCVRQTQPPSGPAAPHTSSQPALPQYVAVGDSIAAGAGLPSLAGSGSSCGRSAAAYPNLLARAQGLTLTNLACAGGEIDDRASGLRSVPAQLDTALQGGGPKLITMTVGANDVHWVFFLRKCFTRVCGTSTDELTANRLNAQLSQNLTALLAGVKLKSDGAPPKIVITGYYDPLSDACAGVDPRLTSAETSWINTQTEALNRTLRDASEQFSFVRFVPIDFTGHDACSADPWVQTMDDPAPLHPTARGQQAIADMIN